MCGAEERRSLTPSPGTAELKSPFGILLATNKIVPAFWCAGSTGSAAAAAPLTSAPQSPAVGMAGTTYVVQRGENLSSIAWRVYGNSNAWACIARANSWIANPNYPQAGWRIVLPASCSSGGG